METIHKQEELIFKEYQALLGNNSEISPDGLHYLGDFYYTNDCWGRDCGDEEEKWYQYCNRKRGLVVLTKELNDEKAWDIREEHARKNGVEEPTPSNHIFYRNLRRWVYALLNMDNKGNIPNFLILKLLKNVLKLNPG